MGNFIFNGVSAADMGLVVERYPTQYAPRKRLSEITIPGRSGVLHQWDGSYENFIQRYVCWFKSAPVAKKAHAIKDWLSAAPAGSRLEDTYDDDVFHLATYRGGADIESCLDRFGRFTVEFDCDPRAFLKTGDWTLNLTSGGLLNNATSNPCFPLIKLDVGVSGAIIVNGEGFSVRNPTAYPEGLTAMLIDTELREVWIVTTDGGEEVVSDWVMGLERLELPPGPSKIELTGDVTNVRFYLRNWRL